VAKRPWSGHFWLASIRRRNPSHCVDGAIVRKYIHFHTPSFQRTPLMREENGRCCAITHKTHTHTHTHTHTLCFLRRLAAKLRPCAISSLARSVGDDVQGTRVGKLRVPSTPKPKARSADRRAVFKRTSQPRLSIRYDS
jgi:hypothetical protein